MVLVSPLLDNREFIQTDGLVSPLLGTKNFIQLMILCDHYWIMGNLCRLLVLLSVLLDNRKLIYIAGPCVTTFG